MDSSIPVLEFVKLSSNAKTPRKASPLSAGFDLASADDYIIPPNGKMLVGTDLKLTLPSGTYGRIAPRSGLAWNSFIDIGGGVIDPDYDGEIKIIIFNFGKKEFRINCGDYVAQIICEKYLSPQLFEKTSSFKKTERGSKGFGSSGLV